MMLDASQKMPTPRIQLENRISPNKAELARPKKGSLKKKSGKRLAKVLDSIPPPSRSIAGANEEQQQALALQQQFMQQQFMQQQYFLQQQHLQLNQLQLWQQIATHTVPLQGLVPLAPMFRPKIVSQRTVQPYKCGKCGEPKAGHTCKGEDDRAKKRANSPSSESLTRHKYSRGVGTQTDLAITRHRRSPR